MKNSAPWAFARATAGLLAALVAAGGGCAAPAMNDAGAPPLCVVHVAAESGLRAGTPLNGRYVATTLEWLDAGLYGVVADGVAVMWPGGHDFPRPPEQEPDFPAAGIFVGSIAFPPNRLLAPQRLRPGQRVLIGGYSTDGAAKLPEYWSVPASFVTATVVDPPHAPTVPDDLIWLSAPPGDYRGFCGGPVGLEAPGSAAGVVGVLLFQHSVGGGDEPALLACCEIPRCEITEQVRGSRP